MEKVDLDRGGPPLMHAANNGHASTVTALLKVRFTAWFRQNCSICALCAVACSGGQQRLSRLLTSSCAWQSPLSVMLCLM